MCTLFSWHGSASFPLLIAANRDEFLARPWSPVRAWPAVGGGAWLGINAQGLVAAITNRLYREHQPTRPSRGSLCVEVLSAPSLVEARRRAHAAVAERAFNGFNLLVGQGQELWLLSYGRGQLR